MTVGIGGSLVGSGLLRNRFTQWAGLRQASSDRRNATAAACSSGDDTLPNGAANRWWATRRQAARRSTGASKSLASSVHRFRKYPAAIGARSLRRRRT